MPPKKNPPSRRQAVKTLVIDISVFFYNFRSKLTFVYILYSRKANKRASALNPRETKKVRKAKTTRQATRKMFQLIQKCRIYVRTLKIKCNCRTAY